MRTSLILWLSLLSFIASAQDIEVTVMNKKAQPVPYAYILINNNPVAISDTSGTAIIPQDKIKDNDTISISFIGSSTVWAIYDKALKENLKHNFIIDESGYLLDDAVVEYFDIKKYYNKNVKAFRQLNYNCKMDANFVASITRPDQKTRIISGKLEGTNEVWSKDFTYRSRGWFHHPIIFITSDDTSSFSRSLETNFHIILNYINKALEFSQPNPPIIDIYKPKYEYLGEKDIYKLFRIIYPRTIMSRFPFQILVYVNQDTKEIHSIELETLTNSENSTFNKYYISYDCKRYRYKKMNPVHLPINIHYFANIGSGTTVDIMITDPIIK